MQKYKTGYLMAWLPEFDFLKYSWVKDCASRCEKFILGIPSDGVYKNIFLAQEYDAMAARDYWLNFKWITDVVILSEDLLSYQAAFLKFNFDACFYGSLYGRQFDVDKEFMKSHGVDFISLVPSSFSCAAGRNAMSMFLHVAGIQKKVVAFGSGAFFDRLFALQGGGFHPLFAVDNDSKKWGTVKNGVRIKSPEALGAEDADECVVVVCSKKNDEIVEQIKAVKSFDYRTLSFLNEIAVLENYSCCKNKRDLDQLTLKKIQDINFEMFKEFDSVCRRHGIEYFINYGTLLGAIRHKGFIPWDNDIDTIMKRDECLKLAQFKSEFSDKYYWLSDDLIGPKKYYDSVTRLGYKDAYIKKTDGSDVFYLNYYNGIHLDMFAVDRTYDNFWGKLQRYELAILYGLMNAYRHKSMFFDYDKKMRFYNAVLCAIGRLIPLKWLKKAADKTARRFNNDKKAPYYFISNCALCKLWLLFPKEIFDKPTVNLPFGGLQVSASAEYDAMCRKIFGDYMRLPPVEQRIPHCGRELVSADLFVFAAPSKRGS